ncbi:MAG: ammonium transporter [Zetaproteobacteria bacterium CG06_land_8_20_14_3_00_59_53]|nr:MAG: ammonium transporter [Zetaproteobacteria bacterium CG2_30_59_37]PIO90848.1 MAG: ammonium transporter [Zetaproteobacteria bacterium CG23_combo_of_CG06-09_8_20_14_all_59_86]PIQ64676.1 MAG: ammonium transporter [Zetaproteobacteria bacterium CG11_big_fil_rev_8_21_14_0_20_59_439]PIU71158.1 MAG: ammonium transporter [Zetaproteobacteria bacterium CG06_land_8_20_14_3_00_59_53]PIU96651.1 MAG: ammonium transporter [Zetaproteobacteria bacterium CG03_land_8_20_14_0_80_59_51]PIY46256.1 MAG: ammoniu
MNTAGFDVFFLTMGAAMVLAMHAGFAFLEAGTVRKKNQVNALIRVLSDFGFSTVAYFFAGFSVAYGINFFAPVSEISVLGGKTNGYEMVHFFFLLTFAAAIPAIISGGITERVRFWPNVLATVLLVGLVYPFYEGLIWAGNYGYQAWLESTFGASFHDFAGSVVVHGMGGFIALGAVILLGARKGRYSSGRVNAILPSNIPFLALGSWILCVGWFGFNVMSAGNVEGASGLVAMNSLLAMVGGLIAALVAGRNDPGFVHNGALAGLVAICAGSDLVHPMGALVIGAIAGAGFVYGFQLVQNRLGIDDVLGVVPLHGGAGVWGGIAAGIFGSTALGGAGGVTFMSQLVGTLTGLGIAVAGGFLVYGAIKATIGIRLSEEDEYQGADLAIHKISSNPEQDMAGH